MEYWTINFDGSVQLQGVGAGILVTSPKGECFKYVLQMHFSASNNAAEYEALLHGQKDHHCTRHPPTQGSLGLNARHQLGQQGVACLDDNMLLNCQEIHKLENNFNSREYLHILQGKNEVADELAKLGSSWAMVPAGVFLQKHHESTISKALGKANKAVESSQETPPLPDSMTESTEVMQIHSDCRTPFMMYLRTGGLLEDKVKYERLHRRAGHYTLVNDELYQ
jgi:hypothetical protein